MKPTTLAIAASDTAIWDGTPITRTDPIPKGKPASQFQCASATWQVPPAPALPANKKDKFSSIKKTSLYP